MKSVGVLCESSARPLCDVRVLSSLPLNLHITRRVVISDMLTSARHLQLGNGGSQLVLRHLKRHQQRLLQLWELVVTLLETPRLSMPGDCNLCGV